MQLSQSSRQPYWVAVLVSFLILTPALIWSFYSATYIYRSYTDTSSAYLKLDADVSFPRFLDMAWQFCPKNHVILDVLTGALDCDQSFGFAPLAENSAGLYRLQIDATSVATPLAIQLPKGLPVKTIQLNGQNLVLDRHFFGLHPVALSNKQLTTIQVEVSNFFSVSDQLRQFAKIDYLHELSINNQWHMITSAVMVGLLLALSTLMLIARLLGVQHGAIYLVISFLSGAIYLFGAEQMALFWNPVFSIDWLMRLEFMGLFIISGAFAMFLHCTFSNAIRAAVTRLYWLVAVTAGMLSLLIPSSLLGGLAKPWFILTAAVLCYFVYRLVLQIIVDKQRWPILGLFITVILLSSLGEGFFYRDESLYLRHVTVCIVSVLLVGLKFRDQLIQLTAQEQQLQKHLQQNAVELQQKMAEAEAASLTAQDASLRKSELMAIMSHEIRTPLSGLIGSIKLLGQAQLNSKEKKLQRNAEQASQSLLEIVNELLDFSRWETGKQTLKPKRFELHQWWQSIHSLMLSSAEEKQLELIFDSSDINPNGLWLYGDSQKIRQVAINLLHNAIKFTGSGWVKMTMRYGGGCLMLIIEDTGPGIAEAEQKNIFQSFVSLENQNDHHRSGAGLGLAITQKIISSLGGAISVNNRESGGCCFSVKIPIQHVDSPQAYHEQPALCPSKQILLVEDDLANRTWLHEALTRLGHQCREAETIERALELLQQQEFDFCLCDWYLPDGTAEKLLKALKTEQQNMPKLVVLSGAITDENRQQYLQQGFVAAFAKPIDIEELTRFIGGQKNNWSGETTADIGSLFIANLPELGEGGLQKILASAKDSATESLQWLQQAVADQDAEQISQAAHRLKSATLVVDLKQVSQVASQIEAEKACSQQQFQQLELMLEQGFQQVHEQLLAAVADSEY